MEGEATPDRLSNLLMRDSRIAPCDCGSEQPEMAIVAVTHALAAKIVYLGAHMHFVAIQPIRTDRAGDVEPDRLRRRLQDVQGLPAA